MQMCSSIDVKGMFIFKVLTRGFLTQMQQGRLSSEAGLRNLGRELIRALCGSLTPGFGGKCKLLSIQLQCISAAYLHGLGGRLSAHFVLIRPWMEHNGTQLHDDV